MPQSPRSSSANKPHLERMLHEGERIGIPAEPWTLTETAFEPERCQYWETLFALSNGFLGLRGSYDEDSASLQGKAYPGMFVNGVYAYKPYHYEWSFPGYPEHGHAMVNLADWRAFDLTVDGERFDPATGPITEYRRQLDMRRAVLTRTLTWTLDSGRRVRLESTRLVSLARPNSAAVRYTVTPLDAPCDVALAVPVKPTMPSQVLPGDPMQVVTREWDGATCRLHLETRTAPFHVGVAVTHCAAPQLGLSAGTDGCPRFTGRLATGRTLALDKHACFIRSTGGASVAEEAGRLAERDAADGFETMLAEHESAWADFWQGADVRIEGNVRDQQAVRFAVFQSRQACPRDGHTSIGANGLTGDKYCGHVFWDTELYVAPMLLYSETERVRGLLMYRYNLLDRARERARQMGHRGALYSWNSISGEECGVVFEAATAEYHLVSAIALCINRYVRNSGDEAFLWDHGAEILFETARFLVDLGCYIPARGNKFCFNAVCGPDEYGCGVNNNCYTNMLAQWHLRYAHDVYTRMRAAQPDRLAALAGRLQLSEKESQEWLEAADAVFIPWNEELGIHEQDDAFLYRDPVDMDSIRRDHDIREDMHPLNLWRMQVVKQADVVLLMFVLSERFSIDQKRSNYDFYEPKTCHGSSLSACIHSIVASEIGRPREAYAYFEHSALLDIADFKGNTAAGVHSACLGGTWMAVVNGFAGLRDSEEGVLFNPVLPEAWNGYAFELAIRGRRLGVSVDADGVAYTLAAGPALRFASGATPVALSPDKPSVRVPLHAGVKTGENPV